MKTTDTESEQILEDRIPLYEEDVGKQSGLAGRIESFFAHNIVYINLVHVVMFVFFMVLLFLPLFLGEPAEFDTPFTHFTITTHYILWALWFPLVFLSVIFTGRAWCGLLCPMGAASEWANKVGPQRALPRWMKWEGTPVVSFIIITTLGQTIGVRDHPEAVAELFGGMMLAAIIIGFIYGQHKRAWCRHMCPIGLLLGVYSRLGIVQFTQKQQRKEGGDQYVERGICPTFVDLRTKDESRHCIECFRCVKPESKGGLTMSFRKPGEEVENIAQHNPNMAEVWFFFLGIGTALGGFLWLIWPSYQTFRATVGQWFVENGMYWVGEPGPWWLMSVHPERREVFNWLDFLTIVGFIGGIMICVASILFATTWLSARLAKIMQPGYNAKEGFIQLAYQYMPIAVCSLLIGIGGELFKLLAVIGMDAGQIQVLKGIIMAVCLLWSFHLGNTILANQGLALGRRIAPLIPGVLGSSIIALIWCTAILGLTF